MLLHTTINMYRQFSYRYTYMHIYIYIHIQVYTNMCIYAYKYIATLSMGGLAETVTFHNHMIGFTAQTQVSLCKSNISASWMYRQMQSTGKLYIPLRFQQTN